MSGNTSFGGLSFDEVARVLAESGDEKAAKYLNKSSGRPRLNVEDEIAALIALMTAGLRQSSAIATVRRRVGASSGRVKTWRRRLKERGTE